MKFLAPVSLILSASLVSLSPAVSAYDGDWKRGRLYYRAVCTACHTDTMATPVAPNAMTKAQWADYLKADKHAKGKDTVSQYWGKAYRESVKAKNRAAERFLAVPEAELAADIRVFVARGAKDGDAPATCN
jgi:hypothetical protein